VALSNFANRFAISLIPFTTALPAFSCFAPARTSVKAALPQTFLDIAANQAEHAEAA